MRSKDETSDRFTMMNQCGDSPQGLEMLPQGWNLQQFGEQYNRSGKRDSVHTTPSFNTIPSQKTELSEFE